MPEKLLIVGASARAAAWSAVRAGCDVVAADLYADQDLRQLCAVHRVENYPDQLASIARRVPPGPWMYTGALENYPSLVDHIAGSRYLWGNAGRTLSAVRHPLELASALRNVGLRCPEVRLGQAPAAGDGIWLRKPLQSCAGAGIQQVASDVPATMRRDAHVYYQQYVPGDSFAGVFVAAAGRAALLAVTRQWIGTPWSGASRFGYAGSGGPVLLNETEQATWQRIGECVSRHFGLRGLFGVDAIQSQGRILPLEVNPRYTASVEVIELATGLPALLLHARAAVDGLLPDGPPPAPHSCWGKGILYATLDIPVCEPVATALADINRRSEKFRVADIPCAGQVIRRGRPILTMLVEAPDVQHAEHELQRRAAQLRSFLQGAGAVDTADR